MTPDANDLCVFAVKRGYIESKEIYCNPLYPTYLSLVEKYQHSPYANGILNNHVAVNPKTDCSLLSDSSEVSFVPMANVQEKTNVVSYDMVAYETVKKGFTVFQRGDLIWAKITPCMQNGKSCIVDKMPTEIGFGSTEFHVIRKRNENVYMPFIWAILSSDDVLKAAQATFSGSAGQQRVSASFIENFPAVLPDYPVQVRLVAELEDKLNLLNGKLQRAYELLHKTPMYLIDRLGLTFDFSATQKITYATTVANIEGRIDADYYSPKFSHFRSQIEALPYRTVSVDDICAAAGVLPGTYERRDATEIVRKIQESVVSHLEQAIRTLERDRLHILLLSALATEQLSVNLNRTGATLTEDIEEGERIKSLEKSTQLSKRQKCGNQLCFISSKPISTW